MNTLRLFAAIGADLFRREPGHDLARVESTAASIVSKV